MTNNHSFETRVQFDTDVSGAEICLKAAQWRSVGGVVVNFHMALSSVAFSFDEDLSNILPFKSHSDWKKMAEMKML